MKRGEIRWYTFRVPDKRRPILILTRNPIPFYCQVVATRAAT